MHSADVNWKSACMKYFNFPHFICENKEKPPHSVNCLGTQLAKKAFLSKNKTKKSYEKNFEGKIKFWEK